MKIAILSHFGTFQPSYALHVGWHERARLLHRYGVNFDFLVNEGVKSDSFPHQVNCLKIPSSKVAFDERVKMFAEEYRRLLVDYDVILTSDLVYQSKGNFLAQNAAMRIAALNLKAWWCHWIHSSWTAPQQDVGYPQNLRFKMPPRSFLVYLNSFELPNLARMYGTNLHNCHAVYNPKDYRSFHNFDPLSNRIIDELEIPEKQAVQIFPFCTTRMDAKGIDGVIHCAAALKRAGINTALILANANSNKRVSEVAGKKKFMESLGLIEGKDFVWTSDLNDGKAVSRAVIADLFKVSNYFVFTSWRETVGNVFQEAKINGCQLVLNYNLPCLREMGGKEALFVQSSFKTPGISDGQSGDFQLVSYNPSEVSYWDEVVEHLVPKLPSLEHKWAFSFDNIWKNQFWPLLHRAYCFSQGKEYHFVHAPRVGDNVADFLARNTEGQ